MRAWISKTLPAGILGIYIYVGCAGTKLLLQVAIMACK